MVEMVGERRDYRSFVVVSANDGGLLSKEGVDNTDIFHRSRALMVPQGTCVGRARYRPSQANGD